MNFGIEGLYMCTIGNYHLQAKLLKVFQKYKQNMKEYARYVRKERTQRRNFQVAKARLKESWKSFTPMSSSSLCRYVYYVSFIDDFYMANSLCGQREIP